MIFPLVVAVIRNNRVILHDDHLPNGGDDTDLEEWTFARDEGRRLHGEETTITFEESEEKESQGRQQRRKRTILEWRDKWHSKAAKWGKSEEELARQVN